MNTFPVK